MRSARLPTGNKCPPGNNNEVSDASRPFATAAHIAALALAPYEDPDKNLYHLTRVTPDELDHIDFGSFAAVLIADVDAIGAGALATLEVMSRLVVGCVSLLVTKPDEKLLIGSGRAAVMVSCLLPCRNALTLLPRLQAELCPTAQLCQTI